MRKSLRASPASAEHVRETQSEHDIDAMRRLHETVPKGWIIDARGPIHYRYGVVEWEVEACDSSHSHCDRGYGASLADAADRCREAVVTAAGR
jgi:hypothetical protein